MQEEKLRLIVLAGQRKAGKTLFLNYLRSEFEPLVHIRIAEAPVKIAELLGLEPTRDILHALFGVNDLLRPVIGEAAFKRRAAKLLDELKPTKALVEAIRTGEEYEEFIVKRGGVLVGLYADPEVRYKRALLADEKGDEAKLSFDEFIAKESHPIEREIADIVSHARYKVENNYDDPASFYKAVDLVLAELGIKKK